MKLLLKKAFRTQTMLDCSEASCAHIWIIMMASHARSATKKPLVQVTRRFLIVLKPLSSVSLKRFLGGWDSLGGREGGRAPPGKRFLYQPELRSL